MNSYWVIHSKGRELGLYDSLEAILTLEIRHLSHFSDEVVLSLTQENLDYYLYPGDGMSASEFIEEVVLPNFDLSKSIELRIGKMEARLAYWREIHRISLRTLADVLD